MDRVEGHLGRRRLLKVKGSLAATASLLLGGGYLALQMQDLNQVKPVSSGLLGTIHLVSGEAQE